MAETERPALSARERQLLKLAANGFTDTAIANHLGISETTVSTYWRRIRTKIGPYSRTELVATVLREQLEKAVTALREEKLHHDAGETSPSDIYKLLVEQAPDAILIVSPNGKIQMLNDTAASLFGWEIDELKGQHISILVPERFNELHRAHISGYIEAPSKRPMRDHIATPGLHKSGNEIPIDASLSTVGEGDDMWVICIVRSMHRRLFGEVVPETNDTHSPQA